MQSPCHHCPKNRQITITATIASLNYAMKNDYCSLVEIHEIWVSLNSMYQKMPPGYF